ncbi:MAG TPA: type II secretion system protein GspM [Stellaceae bacterium]|nr:type II secretion system protein GspM [Stellaceae bacterium]
MNRLPPVVSRLAAVLILLGGIGLLYLALVQPLLDDYLDTQDAIADARASLARYRGVAADLPERQQELARLRQRQATSEGFLQGPNDALVAAQIQNRVKALVEAAHGELKSTQVLPAQDEGKYRRLTIRAQMTLDIAAAQRVLYGVETASPLLFLDNVDLRAHMIDRRRLRGGNPPNDNDLDVRIDVFGYMRAAKASSDGQPAGAASTASR